MIQYKYKIGESMKSNNNRNIIIVIIVILIVFSIFILGISKVIEHSKNKKYEELVNSSLNAMEEYIITHPKENKTSLEILENERLLMNRIDPVNKNNKCTGTIEVKKDKTYIIYLCCDNYNIKYTYPKRKTEKLKDTTKCSLTKSCNATLKSVTVTYDCNGGTGGGTEEFTIGEKNQSLTKSCTKKGYEQVGWKKDKSSKNINYTKKNIITDNWIKTNTPSITLYASWSKKTYTCNKGYYLIKSKIKCSICPENYYCPGGTYKYNKNKDQGKIKCSNKVKGYNYSKSKSSSKYNCYMKVVKNKYIKTPKDKTPTSCGSGYKKEAHNVYYNKTSKCNPKPYKCEPGKYLPKNKRTCANCIEGYFCKGGKFKVSKKENQGLTKCPTGYKESKALSTKITNCYMNVPKNKYVKNKKDSKPTSCGSGSCIRAHKVKYGKTSGPCKCCEAPTVTVSSERDTGSGLTCWAEEEQMYKYNGQNTFTIKGCRNSIHGFMCYQNPKGTNCAGKLEYSGTPYHQNNGFGHMAFDNNKWTYYRKVKYVWVQICNESNKCNNYYEKY